MARVISYDSMLGPTARVTLEGEDYAIVTQGDHVLDINFSTRTIRIYSDSAWEVHSMDRGHRTSPVRVLDRS